jgi:Fe-S cluster assembly iron-binding protein IscA
MVTITEGAAALLAHIQTGQETPSTLRVIVEEGELVIGRSEAAQDDEVYFHGGEPVLRLAADAAKALAGCTVDREETTEGPTLAILPPDEGGEAT